MNHIADALNDVTVTEEITSETPFWAVLAIGLAGRLAADFGARVIRLCEGQDPLQPQTGRGFDHAEHLAALRGFLGEGKVAGDAPALDRMAGGTPGRLHVRLRYGNGDATPTAASGVVKEVVFFASGSDNQADGIPESALTIAARSGLLDIVGRSDARPLMIGGHQISYSTGLSGFLALTALLHSADIDRADVSALGTALWINWKSLAAAAQGRAIPRRSAESGKWRTARCADGYVALVYFDRDWPVLSKMTGDPAMLSLSAERAWTVPEKLAELERRLEAWTLLHDRKDIAAASKSFGLAIGPVWTPAELLADPQYKARQFFEARSQDPAARRRPQLPVLVAAQGASTASQPTPARAHDAAQGPLAGIRVIDLGILTAGASTSAILADLGADVIKVESPTYLDPFRGTPGTSRAEGWWNNSDAFKSTNRNKRGICLDLKSAKGREVFLELAAKSDVVIENFRRGVMQRLGIGYDVLRAANGGILLASVSSQGEQGPDSDSISFGSTLEATSGLAALTAYEDGVPLVTGMDLNYPDQVGSVFAAAAIIAALRSKQRSGVGAHLDISQRELTTYFLGEEFLARDSGISRWGNASPEFLLQDTFATKDGWVAVSIVDERQLASALTLVGQVMRNDLDVHHARQKLAEWMATREAKDICARLREMGIAAAWVADGRAAWDYAMQTNGGAIAPLARSPSGDIVKGFPLHLPQRPISVKVAAPNLGQHTEEVLQEVVGMNADALAGLTRDGIIGTRPASPNASRLD